MSDEPIKVPKTRGELRDCLRNMIPCLVATSNVSTTVSLLKVIGCEVKRDYTVESSNRPLMSLFKPIARVRDLKEEVQQPRLQDSEPLATEHFHGPAFAINEATQIKKLEGVRYTLEHDPDAPQPFTLKWGDIRAVGSSLMSVINMVLADDKPIEHYAREIIKILPDNTESVLVSQQYEMRFILTNTNRIVLRADHFTIDKLSEVAEEVNDYIKSQKGKVKYHE